MRAKGCTERSCTTLQEEQHRHLAHWLQCPLAYHARHEVATRHEHLENEDKSPSWRFRRVAG